MKLKTHLKLFFKSFSNEFDENDFSEEEFKEIKEFYEKWAEKQINIADNFVLKSGKRKIIRKIWEKEIGSLDELDKYINDIEEKNKK